MTDDAPAKPALDQATIDAAVAAIMALIPLTKFSSSAGWVKKAADAVRKLGQVA